MVLPLLHHPTRNDPNLPHRWTREEYYALAAAGAFDEAGRVELLEGELFFMPPQLTPHATAVRKTSQALRAAYGAEFDVSVQLPISLPDGSQPEPDLCVTRGGPDDFADHHPEPGEIVLVVEVSDRTLQKDRTRKTALYARAGLLDYWIVNVIDRQVEAYSSPHAETGRYDVTRVLLPGERIPCPNSPDGVFLLIDSLLPPQTA